jgi:hypothetical protein
MVLIRQSLSFEVGDILRRTRVTRIEPVQLAVRAEPFGNRIELLERGT